MTTKAGEMFIYDERRNVSALFTVEADGSVWLSVGEVEGARGPGFVLDLTDQQRKELISVLAMH